MSIFSQWEKNLLWKVLKFTSFYETDDELSYAYTPNG